LSRLDSRWLSLYQYKYRNKKFKSDIESPLYFFSPEGARDPEKEFAAAIDAFANASEARWGLHKTFAACAFPARKRRLEEIIGRKFPEAPHCTELQKWKRSLNAQKAALVFAGSYLNNPASILGHTLLRLGPLAEEREGSSLLSYTVGFLADASSGDSGPVYAWKGVTGQYASFYDIKPHYMNVALYNNAESRELWEYPLNLSPAEVDFLADHLWELLFNAQFSYYFLDENCSYRLLTLLHAVRPQSPLLERGDFVVLPVNTLRSLDHAGFLAPVPASLRPSLRRRLDYRIAQLSGTERNSFDQLYGSAQSPKLHEASTASLDASLDRFKMETYKFLGKLPPARESRQRLLLEERARRDSAGLDEAAFLAFEEKQHRQPDSGHKSSWIALGSGVQRGSPLIRFEAFLGVHTLSDLDHGFEDVAHIKFLGLELPYSTERRRLEDARINLAEVYSLENFRWRFPHLSWNFSFDLRQDCDFCARRYPNLEAEGGAGLSFELAHRFLVFGLLNIGSHYGYRAGHQGALYPGFEGGLRWQASPFVLVARQNFKSRWHHHWHATTLSASYLLRQDWSLNLDGALRRGSRFPNDESLSLSLKRYY
jgi:hypothetical protein